MSEVEKIVVIPDLHGHADKLEQVVQNYDKNETTFVSLGDVLDGGPAVVETVQILKGIGAVMLLGNHEWVALAAMNDDEPESVWREMYLKFGKKTFESYGVNRVDRSDRILALRERMSELGHLEYIESGKLYFETPEFIAVHAGLTDELWSSQQARLEQIEDIRKSGDYSSEPDQIFDQQHTLATERWTLSTLKTVVSGHAHNRQYIDDGTSTALGRVKLASNLSRYPLFVWESWTGNVVPY